MDILLLFLGCLLVAALISGGIMMFIRSKLKSVRAERTACNYTRDGSFKTTNERDKFLYNTITKIPIPRKDSK